jgi:peptide/nickel transport system ATP-binding protein
MSERPVLLDVRNLRTHFVSREGTLRALNDVSFAIRQGETLGVVGESGCGKTVTSLSILRIVPSNGRIVGGEILLARQARDGGVVDLTKLDPRGPEMRGIRGADIAMVFQEPMTSFSPVYTIGNQIAEVLKLHRGLDDAQARAAAIELLARVEMPKPEQQVDAYSFNLSGGMRQRAMIAMALACSPRLLIADEPTSALDVTIQAQVLDLIAELQRSSGMAVMIVSHDLGVVARMADNVMIMYLGDSMEYGPVDAIYHDARHPYTVGLIGSVPRIRTRSREQLEPIAGNVPSLYERPAGCPFHTRCPRILPGLCDRVEPIPVEVDTGHTVKCHLYSGGARS